MGDETAKAREPRLWCPGCGDARAKSRLHDKKRRNDAAEPNDQGGSECRLAQPVDAPDPDENAGEKEADPVVESPAKYCLATHRRCFADVVVRKLAMPEMADPSADHAVIERLNSEQPPLQDRPHIHDGGCASADRQSADHTVQHLVVQRSSPWRRAGLRETKASTPRSITGLIDSPASAAGEPRVRVGFIF